MPVSAIGIRIEPLTQCLNHRGPDAVGYWSEECVAFGHTRLAIIDLSSAANQPFVDETLGLSLVFNGEIYNYRELRADLISAGYSFSTSSDTEVLLKAYHHWRADAFTRFVGMWAFAIFDLNSKELILCRDRFGIKPLYYSIVNGALVFASELKALSLAGRARNAQRAQVARFLSTGQTDIDDTTFFENIRRMPAATYCRLEPTCVHEEPKFRRYWSAAVFAIPRENIPYRDATNELANRLINSVDLHLRSDVPIGMCVSGGLDSSLIAGICASFLSAQSAVPHSFSAIFPGSWFDESRYVTEVVNRWGLDATYVSPTPQEFEREIDTVIVAQEEPFASTGVYLQWKLFEAIAEKRIKVVLDGQGADEYLAGYLTFLLGFVSSGNAWTRLTRFAANVLPIVAANASTFRRRFGSALEIAKAGLRAGTASEDSVLERIGTNEFYDHLAEEPSTMVELPTNLTPLKRALLHYLTSYSLPSILRFEDRNSMVFSIESRVPYLDHRLVEFCLALPDSYLIRRGRTKAILRDAGAAFLPPSVRRRRLKLGFATPQADWSRSVMLKRLRNSFDSCILREMVNADQAISNFEIETRERPDAPISAFWWRVYNVSRWEEMLSVQ